jgi:hypothetical protein
MLYTEAEKQAYNREKQLVILGLDENYMVVSVKKEDLYDPLNVANNLRYTIYRNLVENLHTYYVNMYVSKSGMVLEKYKRALGAIKGRANWISKTTNEKKVVDRLFIAEFLLGNKKMLHVLSRL